MSATKTDARKHLAAMRCDTCLFEVDSHLDMAVVVAGIGGIDQMYDSALTEIEILRTALAEAKSRLTGTPGLAYQLKVDGWCHVNT